MLAYALARLGGLELEHGRWSLARATLEEAARLARETGQSADLGIALGAAGWLAAAQGDEARCRAAAGEALELARDLGHGARRDYAAPALALLDLGCGRAEAAAHELERLVGLDELEGLVRRRRPAASRARPRGGAVPQRPHRRRRGLRAIAYAEEAQRVGRASALAGGGALPRAGRHRGRAGRAVRRSPAASTSRPATRSRRRACDLLHGERLRREGRRVDARGRLRAALDAFIALGAEPWLARAQSELRASGEVLRRRDPAAIDALTPQELQIALVVSGGRQQPRGGRAAVPQPEDRRVPSRPRVPQARPALARRARAAARPRDRRPAAPPSPHRRERRHAVERGPAGPPGGPGGDGALPAPWAACSAAWTPSCWTSTSTASPRPASAWPARASAAPSACATR